MCVSKSLENLTLKVKTEPGSEIIERFRSLSFGGCGLDNQDCNASFLKDKLLETKGKQAKVSEVRGKKMEASASGEGEEIIDITGLNVGAQGEAQEDLGPQKDAETSTKEAEKGPEEEREEGEVVGSGDEELRGGGEEEELQATPIGKQTNIPHYFKSKEHRKTATVISTTSSESKKRRMDLETMSNASHSSRSTTSTSASGKRRRGGKKHKRKRKDEAESTGPRANEERDRETEDSGRFFTPKEEAAGSKGSKEQEATDGNGSPKKSLIKIVTSAVDKSRGTSGEYNIGYEKLSLRSVSYKDLNLPVALTSSRENESYYIALRDLCDVDTDDLDGEKQIQTTGTMQFILLTRATFKTEDWGIPTRQMFHAFVNRLESTLLADNSSLLGVLKWSNMWGNVGLMGLDVHNLETLKCFREYVKGTMIGDRKFTVFPKEGLMREQQLNMLLMDDLKSFPIDMITKDLFYRNYGLAGTPTVTHVKKFGPNDQTKGGTSKRDWRILKLSGDDEFMDALYMFRDGHKFQIGSSHVQLRGGKRRAATMGEEATDRIESARRKARAEERRRKEEQWSQGNHDQQ